MCTESMVARRPKKQNKDGVVVIAVSSVLSGSWESGSSDVGMKPEKGRLMGKLGFGNET